LADAFLPTGCKQSNSNHSAGKSQDGQGSASAVSRDPEQTILWVFFGVNTWNWGNLAVRAVCRNIAPLREQIRITAMGSIESFIAAAMDGGNGSFAQCPLSRKCFESNPSGFGVI